MRRKWARVLAAALAVVMAIPANLPANTKAAEIAELSDSSLKGATASVSSDYLYCQIDTSDFYLRYIPEYTVNPGQTVDMVTTIVKRGSGDSDYTVVADQTGYTYKWERAVISDGLQTGTWEVAPTTTATMKADSETTWFDEDGVSYYRLTVTHQGIDEIVYMEVALDRPFTLTDGKKYASSSFYRTLGQSVVLDTGIQVDAGYTAEYTWQQYVGEGTNVVLSAPASTNTSTDPSKYAFTPAKEADYGNYVCTINFKDANGVVQYTHTDNFYVYQDKGLVLYDTYQEYWKKEGESITFALDGMSYDSANYKVEYEWYKDGEKLTNTAATYTIPILARADFASTYSCTVNAYKISATQAEMDSNTNIEQSVTKSFGLGLITGLWAYTGDYDIESAVGSKVVLQAYATNLDAAKYPISYQWYIEKYNEDSNENWEEIAGQNGSAYTMEAINSEQFGNYRVVVTDTVHTYELFYTISEDYGWKVNTPVRNVLYKNVGDNVDLTVNIASAASYPITYKWYKETDNGWNVISGAVGATYSLTVSRDVDFTTYRCVASNGKTGCRAEIEFEIIKNDNFYVESLTYSTQYVKGGDTATFQVRATSDDASATYEYAWYFSQMGDFDNSSSGYSQIPGQSSDTLTISNITAANFGSYYVRVRNQKTGATATRYFNLRMANNVLLDYATESVLVRTPGEAASMGITVSNPENLALTYLWEFEAENSEEAVVLEAYTGSTLDIASLAAGQFGEYTCYVLYNNVPLDSKRFIIKKDTKEYLEAEAATDTTQYVTLGSAFTLGVTASTKEGRTLTYQWYDGSSRAIYGATAATYAVTAAKRNDIHSYYCEVSDGEETKQISFYVGLKSSMSFLWDGGTEEDAGSIISIKGTAGKALTLDVTTVDDPSYPTRYTWYFSQSGSSTYSSANIISGASAGTYSIASVGKDTVGYYICEISNAVSTYRVYYYVYFNTGLKISTTATEYQAAVGDAVTMKASVSSNKKYPATMQWYYYDEDYEYISDSNTESTGKWVPLSGATTGEYSIAAVTKANFGDYKLEVKTDGEIQNVGFTLEEKAPISITRVVPSTWATLPGSKITLNSTVDAPKDATVEYSWYVEDAITGDYVRAKTTGGKLASAAKVSVNAPSKIVADDTNSDVYQYISYRLKVKSVINGKTETDYYSVPIMVVNPTMNKKAPASAHNYKAGVVTTYGYKATGSIASLKVTFDKKFSINKNGDYLYLINANGKATRYYGTELKNKTVSLTGKKFAVVLVSTNADAKNYGFAVSKIVTTKKTSGTPSKLTLGVKEKHKITGIVAKGKKATYKSSKKKVASVSKKGVIQAKKQGKAKITVKVGKKKTKITVTVKPAPKKLKLAKKKVTIKRGKSASVKYSFKAKKAASYKMTVTNAKALKKSKLTVSAASGKLNIKVAKKAKKKMYKVTVATYNKKKATLKVKVK